MIKTIDPIWSDEDYVIVRDPLLHRGNFLSTTHLVYAPDGAKVEIIPDVELTASADQASTDDASKPVTN